MADPKNFVWDAPQWTTFTKNLFGHERLYSEALMYWFSPGTIAQLRIYSLPDFELTGIWMNSQNNWDAVGDDMTLKYKSFTTHSFFQKPPVGGNPPTLDIDNRYEWNAPQIAFPVIDSSTRTRQRPFGDWTHTTPAIELNVDTILAYSPPPGAMLVEANGGTIPLAQLQLIRDTSIYTFRQTSPQNLIYDNTVEGTACLSLNDIGSTEGIVAARTEILSEPTDSVAYRCVMPQVYRCGFISFGMADNF